MEIAKLLDRAATSWLEYRTRQEMKNAPFVEMGIKNVTVTDDNCLEITGISPVFAALAQDAAAMLEHGNAKNYVEFEIVPRIDKGTHPIRCTIQWAGRYSPHQRATEILDVLLDVLKTLKHHHKTRPGINTIIQDAEARIEQIGGKNDSPYTYPKKAGE